MGETISVVLAGDVLVPAAPDHEVIATTSTGHAAVAHALIEVPDVMVLDVPSPTPTCSGSAGGSASGPPPPGSS